MTSTTELMPLRYDSPTVTLEVMVREAAVSQWSDRPVVQVWRYQVQVRDWSDETSPVEIRGDRTTFLPLVTAVQDYVQAQLTGAEAGGDRAPDQPHLTPHGLTRHMLHLGHGRTTTNEPQLVLGAVQLADFAAVLEQLDQAVRPLPVALGGAARRPSWRRWGAAAAGMVAAVGVTTALWPHYQSPQRLETAQEAPTADSVSPADSPEELDARSPQPPPTPEAATESADPAAESAPPADSPTANPPAIAPLESAPEQGLENAPAAPESAPPAPESAPAVPTPESPPDPAQNNRTAAAPAEEGPPPAPAPPAPAELAPDRPAADSAPASPPADRADPAETAADAAPDTFAVEAAPTPRGASVPGTLADLVAQVRDRWRPPAALDQPLIYTLVLAADGTLMAVIPADERATEYRDRTGIPPTGTIWASADNPQRVQLQLQPDGSVTWQAVPPAVPQ